MERTAGSMGSEFTRFQFAPEEIPVLARLDWNGIARRVFIDPVNGVIALTSPSSKHERYACGAGLTAIALGERLGIRAIALGATRWRRPEDPDRTGAEPDACLYLGAAAERRVEARRQGETALCGGSTLGAGSPKPRCWICWRRWARLAWRRPLCSPGQRRRWFSKRSNWPWKTGAANSTP